MFFIARTPTPESFSERRENISHYFSLLPSAFFPKCNLICIVSLPGRPGEAITSSIKNRSGKVSSPEKKIRAHPSYPRSSASKSTGCKTRYSAALRVRCFAPVEPRERRRSRQNAIALSVLSASPKQLCCEGDSGGLFERAFRIIKNRISENLFQKAFPRFIVSLPRPCQGSHYFIHKEQIRKSVFSREKGVPHM